MGLDGPCDPATAAAAARIAASIGTAAVALIHYGSTVRPQDAGPGSARDFFVVVDRYAEAYHSLAAAGAARIRPGWAAALNQVMPPNVISARPQRDADRIPAKCAVFSLEHLRRECSDHPRDHWTRARLCQDVRIAWARDAAARETVAALVAGVRRRTFDWARPFLPTRFEAHGYCRALLAVSYAAEVRPEANDRSEALVQAQWPVLGAVYGALLEALAAAGRLTREEGAFRDPAPPGTLVRARARAFFALSKLRATLRWGKYIALYEDWLDYALAKVERRGGERIELTDRERRWPLLFLWPRAIGYLRRRPQKRP